MWLDTASNIDLLFYSPYADTIVDFTKNVELTPLTIGLYGSWGAGKSSLLELISQKICNEYKQIACVSINAWQFEDYEDAKVAIMEALIKALEDNKSFTENLKGHVKKLLTHINYFKLGKDLLTRGAPYAIGLLTGNPLPIALNLPADINEGINAVKAIGDSCKQYLSDDEACKITESVRTFRRDFENMLNDASSIDNLVVIVDDLDRCAPDRIIDTLEAIKLFLSVKKTTFVIAVDQKIIEYAVNEKYPKIGGTDISRDYIEKIIQLPIKIPELSPKDIENYLLLLICQLHLDNTCFENILSKVCEQKLTLADTSISKETINSLITDVGERYKNGSDRNAFDKDIDCVIEIRESVSGSLKGNPRQAKRFLNTFFVRKSLAKLYFGEEIDISILAKLLVLETISPAAFKELYEWNRNFNGEIIQLKEIEVAVEQGKSIDTKYNTWANTRLEKWLQSSPKKLHKIDLSKYFYLSRESLRNAENTSMAFNEQERKLLSDFQNCIQGQEDGLISDLLKVNGESQAKICNALISHFEADSIPLSIICRIYDKYEGCRSKIIDVLRRKPTTFSSIAAIPHIARMYSVTPNDVKQLLDELEREKIIEASFKQRIVKPIIKK